MPYCAIITCKNKSQVANVSKGGISYHRFPREPDVNEQWIKATGRKQWFPTNTSTVCSAHFLDTDFAPKPSGHKYLMPQTIPTVDVWICNKATQWQFNYFTYPGSAPCRIVLLTAAALNIHLDLNLVDLRAGEQLQPEFLKMNPQHTVPTIVDGDFTLWESRAISRYLVNKYRKDSSLYPEEPKTRAMIDQRMDFDLGTLYPRFGEYFYPQVFGGAPADAEKKKRVEEALGFLNSFLEGHTYAVGSELTLADLSLIATVSTMEASDINFKAYPNVKRWYELVKSTAPNYEKANDEGVQATKAMVASLKKTEL